MMDQSIAIGSKDKNTQTVFLTVEFLFKCPFLSLWKQLQGSMYSYPTDTYRAAMSSNFFFFFFFPFYLIDSVRAFLSFWRERIEREREAFKEGGGKRRTTSGSCPSLPTKNKERIDWQFRSRLDTGINTFWRYTTREFLSIQIVSFSLSLERDYLLSQLVVSQRGGSLGSSLAPHPSLEHSAQSPTVENLTHTTHNLFPSPFLFQLCNTKEERERDGPRKLIGDSFRQWFGARKPVRFPNILFSKIKTAENDDTRSIGGRPVGESLHPKRHVYKQKKGGLCNGWTRRKTRIDGGRNGDQR